MLYRLKSLELQGYKTFANRTIFEFPAAVTAIVGPNGSGKSNIADALRWVLGEQSYSLLRGKKTEDMIFAGSETRSRAGMASATVVFNNDDGWLPIDFSEVAIARRAYRDGDNEYLLNGQRVRLKDISELLAESGLAERTYTVIGQGLVDAALSLRAEERRRLFEEAAGIGLHRSRREEALRRLETTQRNLERVEDILAELRPRVSSLERQARRSKEYEQIQIELRELLREWYGYHWHLAQSELTFAHEAARAQEQVLNAARKEQAQLDTQLNQENSNILRLREKLNNLQRRSADLHNQREEVTRELAVSSERVRFVESQGHEIVIDTAAVNEQIKLIKIQLGELEAATAQILEEKADVNEHAGQAQEALATKQAQRQQADKDLENTRNELSSTVARHSDLNARLAEKRLQVERQQAADQKSLDEIGSAEKSRQYYEERVIQSAAQFQQAGFTLQEAETKLTAVQREIKNAQSALKETNQVRATLANEQTRLQTQFEIIENAERSFTGYSEGAKKLLESSSTVAIKGLRGALLSHLIVPEQYESAISAALGDFLDAVLIDDPSQIDPLLTYIDHQSIRSALVPLEPLVQMGKFELELSNEGIHGWAEDLVTATDETAAVVRLLLGDVLVVEDRNVAQQTIADLRQGGTTKKAGLLRVVTLKGEIFEQRGSILAGHSKKQGILSRSRQKRELRVELEKLEKAITRSIEQVSVSEKALQEVIQKEKLNSEEVQASQKAHESLRIAHSQDKMALEQLDLQIDWLRKQRAQQAEETAQASQSIKMLIDELDVLNGRVAELNVELRQRTLALAEFDLQDLQTELAFWNTRQAVLDQSAAESDSRRQDRLRSLASLQERVTNLSKKQGELVESQRELENSISTLVHSKSDLDNQIELLRTEIEPTEKELSIHETIQHDLRGKEMKLRISLSQAEQYYAQARIAQARRQESLESLQHRIEDDFGLVAFEYEETISGPTPLPFEGFVERLPRVSELKPETEEAIKHQKTFLRRMGPINPDAQNEYNEVKARFDFLTIQLEDLQAAALDVRQVITELDELMQREFLHTFSAVAEEFHQIFSRLFGGGTARLVLTDPDDITETGIDIEARLPGRREQGLSLLSGGERSLTAVALVFSLLRVSPTPFCILDEVDAMLDEANVGRFRDLLRELSQSTQFILITHNRATVQVAEVLYGVTMGRDSTSQIVSLKMDEVEAYGEV